MRTLYIVLSLLLANQLYAQAPALVWASSFSSGGVDEGRSVAVDADGYVYTVGNFNDTADFDPGTGTFDMSSTDLSDIYIVKLSPSGDLVWAKSIGGTGSDIPSNVILDGTGQLYITGQFAYRVDFDPGPDSTFLTANANADVFVLKMDTVGNFLWANGFGGDFVDNGLALAVDDAGNVYNVGQYTNNCDFDPDTSSAFVLTARGSSPNAYIVKFDASGNFIWARGWGGTSSDAARDMEIDEAGDLYIVGSFTGLVDFDLGLPIYYFNAGSSGTNGYLLKLNSAGDYIRAKDPTPPPPRTTENCVSIRLDPSGNLYLCGSFSGTADFDPGSGNYYVSALDDNLSDIFVEKLDANADFLWAISMGGRRADRPLSMAVNQNGSVYLTGSFTDTADFDPGPGTLNLMSEGSNDAFICRLEPDGHIVWAAAFNGPEMQNGNSIALDTNANIYLTGNFRGACDFDPNATSYVLNPQGSVYDAFVLKLNEPANLDIEQPANNTKLSLYPNPASSETTLVSIDGFANSTISLFQMNGQLLQEWTGTKQDKLSISLAGYAPGIYMLEVRKSNSARQYIKLVKE